MQKVFESSSYSGSQMDHLPQNMSPESNKRPGIPPSHPNNSINSINSMPYSHMMSNSIMGSGSGSSSSHNRSLSQPSFFSLDCLPPLSPSNPLTYNSSRESPPMSSVSDPNSSHNVSNEERVNRVTASRVGENLVNLPPRKGHRRSSSDIPLGFSAMIQSSPQLIPIASKGVTGKPIQLVKRESEWNNTNKDCAINNAEGKPEGEVVDDLFNEYMNLDNIDTLNSSGTEDKDLDSRASGKTNGCESSDNEVESRANGNSIGLMGTSSSEKREGIKRSASGEIAPTVRHYRSVSMDSFIGNLRFDDESPKLPLGGQLSPGSSIDGNLAKISLELRGEFNEAEMKKILANDKLAEIALSDPKRAKRILANRQSAARSKERKMHYIAELEQKVQTLQIEATTLSAQVTMLQRDSAGLTSQNNELRFRLQAMEQQAQLKDALNEALAAEVQRLKLAAAEISREAHLSSLVAQQLSINNQMFPPQHQQPNQLNVFQMQKQQGQQMQQQPQLRQLQSEQQNGAAPMNDPKK